MSNNKTTYFLNYNKIKYYRYAIAKVVFLVEYKDIYDIREDIKYSNVMLLKEKKTDELFYISIFGKPNFFTEKQDKSNLSKKQQDQPLLKTSKKIYKDNFYVKGKYPNRKYYSSGKTNIEINEFRLYDSFNNKYDEAFKIGFFDPSKFNKEYEDYRNLFDYYYGEIDDIEKEIEYFYKYRSVDSFDNRQKEILNGELSFSAPKKFNDPFDCDDNPLYYDILSNNFRVLCLTKEYDNILMWSYYSSGKESHDGFCLQYKSSDILKGIKKLNNIAIYFFGYIYYNSNRKLKKVPTNIDNFTNLNDSIENIFTKFTNWSHENEFRFVIIDDYLQDYQNFVDISPGLNKVYLGINNNDNKYRTNKKDKSYVNSNGTTINSESLQKDLYEYKLYI